MMAIKRRNQTKARVVNGGNSEVFHFLALSGSRVFADLVVWGL
jgi:hypothetical protein